MVVKHVSEGSVECIFQTSILTVLFLSVYVGCMKQMHFVSVGLEASWTSCGFTECRTIEK